MEGETVVAGIVARPHGLDGSVHVVQAVPALLAAGRVLLVEGVGREILRRAGTDDRPILRLAGCEQREAAEALRGLELRVPRTDAPALEDDEWWAEDLVGCRIVDSARPGTELGVVSALVGLPSCEALEVGGRLVPLVRDAVRAVDVQARLIDVDLEFLGE